MLPRQPSVVRQRQREARREVGRQRRRGRRRLRRQRAQEAPAVQGPGCRPRAVLQDPPHPDSEAEAGSGEQPEPAAEAGRGLVPEPPRQDEAEADGGGLRVPEALVRAARRGEPAPPEGGRRAEGAQGGGAGRCGGLLDDTDNVPLLQARRVILGLYSQGGQPLCRSRRRRRQCRRAFSGGAARTPAALLWIQRDRSNVRRLLWTRKGGQGSQIERALLCRHDQHRMQS